MYMYLYMSIHRDFNIFSSHGLLPSDLVAQSVERRRSNPKVVGSIPTLVRLFLCPCVGPFPSLGLTLTWFIRDKNLALHITHYSVNSILVIDEFTLLSASWIIRARWREIQRFVRKFKTMKSIHDMQFWVFHFPKQKICAQR